MKRLFLTFCIICCPGNAAWTEEADRGKAFDESHRIQKEGVKLDAIHVTAPATDRLVDLAPESVSLDLMTYEAPRAHQNISDYMKDLIMFDSREQSNLVHSNDTLYMRGFNPRRFLVAVDSMPVEKSGFGFGNHAVDYAVIPLGLIETIEIISGPHSAVYPGQAIAGVVNLKTRAPRRHAESRPGMDLSAAYESYDTMTNRLQVNGGVDVLGYQAGCEMYRTDGYLRNAYSNIDTVYGRLEWLFANDGFLTFTGTHTTQDIGRPVNNDPGRADHESGYPVVTVAGYNPDQAPTTDKTAHSFRFSGELPTALGTFSLGAYYNRENLDHDAWLYIDPQDPGRGLVADWFARDAIWEQMGLRFQDEIRIADNHLTTIGLDAVLAYSERQHVDRHKRLERIAGYLQHQWQVLTALTLTGGLRYETVSTWIHNRGTDRTTGATRPGYLNNAVQKDYVERNFHQMVPKFFATYRMDELAETLRDTSLSLGASRIWHAPTSGMDMHGNGMPGFHVEPEHGLGIDVTLMRRLVSDIHMRLNLSYYEINDYIAYINMKYAKYFPTPANPVPPGKEFLDIRPNIDGITRKGVELEITGHIVDNVSFLVGYAYMDFENKGNEPVGQEEVGGRAEHRVKTSIRYNPFVRTALFVDHQYQSRQKSYVSVETAPDQWRFHTITMDEYHVFDIGVEHTLFKKWKTFQNARLKLFINNLFDENYQDAQGYPMTDRSFGAALTVRM